MESKETRAANTAAAVGTPADELALRGGLHGRMAGAFCTLQSSVDALRRYLAGNSSQRDQAIIQSLLDEMNDRIACLERLSYNAARLATGALARGTEELAPLELTGYLAEMADCTNETLAMRGFAARIEFTAQQPNAQVWCEASSDLLDGILTNLLSNLLMLRPDGVMRLTMLPDRQLLYTDNGPGMDRTLARALLEQGCPPREILDRVSLGLLLVRDYCMALNWSVTVEQAASLQIRFQLPAFAPPATLTLQDSAGRHNAFLHAHLDRELNGVFGAPGKDPVV